jgi:hypothetical protein
MRQPKQAGRAPEPTLVIKSSMLLFAKSFANREGQNGSTSMPAALVMVVMFSACKPTVQTTTIACEISSNTHCNLQAIIVKDQGRIGACKL